MKESYWGYWLIVLGVFVILIMLLVQNVTSTNTQDYYLAKEIAEAAMVDSVDYGYYRQYGEVRIIKEKFVESFVRRFAESASPNTTYELAFYELYEVPPKVSVKVSTNSSSFNIAGDASTFKVVNKIDMIMETDPSYKYPSTIDTQTPGADYGKDDGSSLKTLSDDEGQGYLVTIKNGGSGNGGETEYKVLTKTGQVVEKDCITLTATFDPNGADGVGYKTFKCNVPKRNDGTVHKEDGCDVIAPQILNGNGNVYGFNSNPGATSSSNNIKVGSKIHITDNTTYFAIAEQNKVTLSVKFVTAVNGLEKIDKSYASCELKTGENSCNVTLPNVTASKYYSFLGWSTKSDGSTGLYNAGTTVTLYKQNGKATEYVYYPVFSRDKKN